MKKRQVLPFLLLIAVSISLTRCRTGEYHAARTSTQPGPFEVVQCASTPCAPPRCLPERYDSGCRPMGPCDTPVGEIYAGLQAVAFPAWGIGVEFGQVFGRSALANWSFEVDAAWEDLDNEIGGSVESGDFAHVRGSIKAELLPLRRFHPTVRGGFGWFRTTGRTDWVGAAGDFIAFHLGVGLEFDITQNLTTGPEVTMLIAAAEKGLDVEVVPQARWHLIWRF